MAVDSNWFPYSASICAGSGWPIKPPPFLQIVITDDAVGGWGYYETRGIHSREQFGQYLAFLNGLADEVFGKI